MPTPVTNSQTTDDDLVRQLLAFIDRSVVAQGGSTQAVRPAHRVKFHWPPYPVSYSFHVLASDWTGRTELTLHGETFEVEVARHPNGVFGRIQSLWHEDRGDTLEEMRENLRNSLEPLFQRQWTIARTLERNERFQEHVCDLEPADLIKLLYCPDRDVANEAQTEIEKRASGVYFLPALLAVLDDRRHAQRRSAQWCVLDLFEDLPSFARTAEDEADAVESMKRLIWTAEDDYARTIYKAGVVLGGHLPDRLGGPTLIECLQAPSSIGRRAAIHGLFHVVEWQPDTKTAVLTALEKVAENDPEPILREYASGIAGDIQTGDMDHVPDPLFPGEA